MPERTIRVHFIDDSERIVPAKDFHWHEEGAQSATAIVDGREVPVYKRSEPEWGPLWYEQLPLTEFGDEHALDETGTHPPDCRCGWCEPESDTPSQADIDREYRTALREGGYYACFPESEGGSHA